MSELPNTCKCCVNGVKGRICVFCTRPLVENFAAAHCHRYFELHNKCMTSLSHDNNLAKARAMYDQYRQNNAAVLDIRLIEMIISLALRKQIENIPYMTIKKGELSD